MQRAAEPVHVTLRARLAPLRSQHVFPTIRLALLRAGRRDPARFRLLQFSVQRDHVHLIVEAKDKRALSSGVRSIAIRIARYVNELLSRRGPLWADRWHGRALKTPREVRNALVYVLANFKKHARDATGLRKGGRAGAWEFDRFSSAEWFDGWRDWQARSGLAPPWSPRAGRPTAGPMDARTPADETAPLGDERAVRVVAEAQSWLARVGWRRYGLIGLEEAPFR